MLKYPAFAASSAMEAAAHKGPALRQSSKGPAVALLQGALIDLGFKLPKSTRKTGAPDGLFGWETAEVLRIFQRKHGLEPDGVAGPRTIGTIDQLYVAKTPIPAPKVPPPPPPPRTAHYQFGWNDPTLRADPGAGRWNSKATQAVYAGLKVTILRFLPEAALVVGMDAAKHMSHYFGNSGKPYPINLEGMLEQVKSARECLDAEAAQAQEFAETLPPGKHRITSRHPEGGYNEKEESWNWYFATGGYSSWGRGELAVSEGAGKRRYVLDFEYRFFDRYNWDKGKQVKLAGITITDEFMGEFHKQGLAREFDCHGTVKRRLTWNHGDAIPTAQLDRPAGGRA